MNLHRQQSGFALLLLLFALLSAGLAGLSQAQRYKAGMSPGFTTDQFALQSARQALLAYTALYPWLYGPRGAGPGHLPCPDTDAMSMTPWLQASSRDGPNPPCGSGAKASGQLPRHVNLPGHRYVFHVEPYQRLEYQVSSAMINNPVNRVVNDEVIRADQQRSPFVAWIRQPLGVDAQARMAASQVPVSRESLLPVVRQSVAAWLVGEVNRERGAACSPPPEWFSESTSLNASDVLSLIAHRESEFSTLPSVLPAHDSQSCLEYPSREAVADDRLIEGVPLASHWFVRNDWPERIVMIAEEHCATDLFSHCLLVSDPRGLSIVRPDERLYFVWRPAS